MQINIKLFSSLMLCVFFLGCEATPRKNRVDVKTPGADFHSLLNEYRCDEQPNISSVIKTYKHGEYTTYESAIEVLCAGMPHSEHYLIAASYKFDGNQRLRYMDLTEKSSLEGEVALAIAYAGLSNSDCKDAIYSKKDVYFFIGEDGDKVLIINAAYPAMECTIEYDIDNPEKSRFPFY